MNKYSVTITIKYNTVDNESESSIASDFERVIASVEELNIGNGLTKKHYDVFSDVLESDIDIERNNEQ